MNSKPSNENTKYQCWNCRVGFDIFYPKLLNADGSVDFCSLACRKDFNKKLTEMPINTYRDKTDGLDVYEPHSYGIDPNIMEKAETYESIKHFSKENNYDF
tara:strand:+ start:611 stop:913 length:303 start_codon:yes stop_codon:yes gene_type:complete